MVFLWTVSIEGNYWVHWEEHDGQNNAEGEVEDSEHASSDQAIETLSEMYEALLAGGIPVRKTPRKHTPRLDVTATARAVEATTSRKLGHRP